MSLRKTDDNMISEGLEFTQRQPLQIVNLDEKLRNSYPEGFHNRPKSRSNRKSNKKSNSESKFKTGSKPKVDSNASERKSQKKSASKSK